MLAALGKLADGAPAERLLLSEVLPVAEQLADDLRAHPASDAVEVAGSARRRTETCHDIDLIATASEPAALAQALVDHPLAATKGSSGEGGARITTHNGIAVDLRIVAPAAYGNLLQHFTGSAEHNIELRERAVGMELSVSEHGITDTRTGEVSTLRDRGRGLRAPRPRLHRARAARGQRRDRGRRRRHAAGAGRHGGHSGRPPLPHHDLRRPQHARGDGRGRAGPRLRLPRGHRPLRQPRLRQPRHRGAAVGADPGGAGVQLGPPRAFGCSPARRSTSSPTARSTTRTTCSPSSTG